MSNDISDNVALVMGGGSGIGRAVVEAFVGEDMNVGVLEISPEKIEELEELGSDIGLSSLDQEEEAMLASQEMQEGLKSIVPLQIEIAPEDHAGAYLYLANKEQSRSVTGVVINSDGGLGARGLTKVAGLL
jgi:NAD(P)-dependent dehydrogenase (short-subunit alcohol dehydrogenase family)